MNSEDKKHIRENRALARRNVKRKTGGGRG